MTRTVRLPEPFRLHPLDAVDSTNEEAKRLAATGTPGGTVVWARSQTAGKGRRGHGWASGPGNLYCSVLLRPDWPPAEAGQATFAVANAVADTVAAVVPEGRRVTCKWPNDVLVDGRKVSGILLESRLAGDGERLDWLVVGVGLNVAHHPEGTEWPATSLQAAGADPPAIEALLVGMLGRLHAWIAAWRRDGFAVLRDAWLARAHGLGGAVRVRLEGTTRDGVFESLDESGALVLRQADGCRRLVAAGEVFPAA